MTKDKILQYSKSTEIVKIIGSLGIVDLDAQLSLLTEVLTDESEDLSLSGVKSAINRAFGENIKSDKFVIELAPEYDKYLYAPDEVSYMRSRGISFTISKIFYLWCLQKLHKEIEVSHRKDEINRDIIHACIHDWVILGLVSKRVSDGAMVINQLIKCLVEALYEDSWDTATAIKEIRKFLLQ